MFNETTLRLWQFRMKSYHIGANQLIQHNTIKPTVVIFYDTDDVFKPECSQKVRS